MSLCVVVFVILLVLKLVGIAPVVAWSWWIITLPLWIGFAIMLFMVLLGSFIAGLAAMFSARKGAKWRSGYNSRRR